VERAWTRAEAWASGVYVNFLADRAARARVHEAHPAATYQRLADVKAKYDPETASGATRTSVPRKSSAGAAPRRL